MGHPAVSQVFSPVQFWLSKVQTESGNEKDHLLRQVLFNGQTQMSMLTSFQQNHIHYTKELGTMPLSDSLCFYMAACESRSKDSKSTMITNFPNC